MRINIISTNNGVGLYQDYLILKDILTPKHKVNFIDFKSNSFADSDINIHLEVVNPKFLQRKTKQVLIPNPEWFALTWKRYLPQYNEIWVKTHHAENIFNKLHSKVVYTGFTSIDRQIKGIKKERIFLHNRGKSSHKGTETILEVFKNRTEKLIINSAKSFFNTKQNILINTDRLTDNDLNVLLNSCMFHLCPSKAEGFGHYINEARSVGAVIISSNAQPMNELVTKDNGFLIDGIYGIYHNLVKEFNINNVSLNNVINECLNLSDSEIKSKSEQSRLMYENDKAFFINKLNEII
jgi:hypothetical protein